MKRDTADARFSLAIRQRDKFTCQRCGTPYPPKHQGLHSAHMFGRGKPATRLDPENACALCYGCHRYLDTHPDLKREFFRARLGVAAFEALELRSNGSSRRFVCHRCLFTSKSASEMAEHADTHPPEVSAQQTTPA